MDFENLDEIKSKFINGKFDFPDEFDVSNVTYRFRSSSSFPMEDMIKNNTKGIIIYNTAATNVQDRDDLHQWIIFLWTATPNNLLTPYDVRSISNARGNIPIKEVSENNDFIGSVVNVYITNIAGTARMKGKIDTGADISSLHATQWKVKNDLVEFVCPELSPNIISVPLVNHQAVKSADGGTEYRPVIELNVRINEKLLTKMLFNLNDRGKMQHPVLVGKNILTAGKFKIDPSLDESSNISTEEEIDWDYISEQVGEDVISVSVVKYSGSIGESPLHVINILQNYKEQ